MAEAYSEKELASLRECPDGVFDTPGQVVVVSSADRWLATLDAERKRAEGAERERDEAFDLAMRQADMKGETIEKARVRGIVHAHNETALLISQIDKDRDTLRAEVERLNIERARMRAVAVERDSLRDRCRVLEKRLAGQCETCEGDGLMQCLVRVEAPYEEEVYETETCAECRGTGYGWLADEIKGARVAASLLREAWFADDKCGRFVPVTLMVREDFEDRLRAALKDGGPIPEPEGEGGA